MRCMDLNLLRKRLSPSKSGDQGGFSVPDATRAVKRMGFGGAVRTLASLLLILSVFIPLSFVYRTLHSDRVTPFAEARVLDHKSLPTNAAEIKGSINYSEVGAESTKAHLLDGLLVAGFDDRSCLSRYHSYLYRKVPSYKPSSYLLSRLRKYEELHKRCGPHSPSYNEALKQLKSGGSTTSADCNYVVWIHYSGLGNRILTIAATFLYALLTDRVLLIDPGADMTDLFCEPFPNASWFLPANFDIKSQFHRFDQKSPLCHGYLLKNNLLNTSSETSPSYLYLHLGHDYGDHDKLFFCDDEQSVLAKVPWLIMRTDNYFVPTLFLMPSFEQELSRLFPEKVALFHLLGRYLFHPTNQVWGLVTRYYNAYLAKADEKIGLQVRVFESGGIAFPHVKDQIMACVLKEKLLPEVHRDDSFVAAQPNPRSKAVLVTSLLPGYYETLREAYWEHETVSGEVIGFYQPSHEEFQQTEKTHHNRKAWAEMYLLSLTDKLVTSAWSTFGYVAQGLGGLKPWILYKSENKITPDPPCVRAMSMEPCFHAPPFWDCKAKKGIDTGLLVPHVKHCEDISWGLKVVDGEDDQRRNIS